MSDLNPLSGAPQPAPTPRPAPRPIARQPVMDVRRPMTAKPLAVRSPAPTQPTQTVQVAAPGPVMPPEAIASPNIPAPELASPPLPRPAPALNRSAQPQIPVPDSLAEEIKKLPQDSRPTSITSSTSRVPRAPIVTAIVVALILIGAAVFAYWRTQSKPAEDTAHNNGSAQHTQSEQENSHAPADPQSTLKILDETVNDRTEANDFSEAALNDTTLGL